MDPAEAHAVLGVEPTATAGELRAAFRRLLRANHPDVAGPTPAANASTLRIIEAYRTARQNPPAAPRAVPPPGRSGLDVVAEGDTIVVPLPADEAFFLLLEAAHELGEVSYVDADAGLLETIVVFVDGPVCSVVLSLQGRANGTTEAFCTVEALGADAAPPASAVAKLIAATAAALAPRRRG